MHLEPGTVAHVWRHHLLKSAPPSEHEYGLLVAESLDGRLWAATTADGDPVALGGCLPTSADGAGRVWLSVTPAASALLLPLVRLMRRRLADEAAGHDGVVCVVRDENMAGRRLAAVLGFIETDRIAGRGREWRLEA